MIENFRNYFLKQILFGLGYTEIVELLIRNGANINQKDNFRNTPFVLAKLFGNCNYVNQEVNNHCKHIAINFYDSRTH